MSTIANVKAGQQKWTPTWAFNVMLKDGTPRYWGQRAFTWNTHPYLPLVIGFSPMKIEGGGVYGVNAVVEIALELDNADTNLNGLIVPSNWQGGTIQPFAVFEDPDNPGTFTSDSIAYPKFLLDLPTETWPRVVCAAHNKWNLARKVLPSSVVTRKDRYPFPNTAAERAAAGSDPTNEFYPIGYDPANGKGDWKTPPDVPYMADDYDGTREKLAEIGLSVRYGGFGKAPATMSYSPKKGQVEQFEGSANEAKIGQAVPLIYGICRIAPIVLDTGMPDGWNGARLSHLLLSDAVTFAPAEGDMGIVGVYNEQVYLPEQDGKKTRWIPSGSAATNVTGSWTTYTGAYGNQVLPASSKYRNIDPATDFLPPDFPDRDPYSGLAFLVLGLPKELAQPGGIGPRVEVVVKGLKVETWDAGGSPTWQWSDNPVWIYIDLLKRLRWSVASDIDKSAAYAAAAYCDGLVDGIKRFRCNLALTQQMKAADILRGVANNCRLYTAYGGDGKLQIKIERDLAGEGGTAFALDETNIIRDASGRLLVRKWHRSVFETANVFSASFQNEMNQYTADSLTLANIDNINQIDERISADSITAILGLPRFDQAERVLNWLKYKHVDLNEYYQVSATLAMIEAKVGQVGTITEPRLGLSAQECRILAMSPGPGGTIELTLQKDADAAYSDTPGIDPVVRARSDTTYTPRSVGGLSGATGGPTLTELFIQGDTNYDNYTRKIKVEFTPPPTAYEDLFSEKPAISNGQVATTGGSIAGNQHLFVEVCPRLAGVDGLASDPLHFNVPAGTNTNKLTLDCDLPPEATHYAVRVGSYPGKLFKYATAVNPGGSFQIVITDLASLDSSSLSPDPGYDHAHIFYYFSGSPQILRDGGRTQSATQSSLIFEPDLPEGEDAQITVIVCSANAAETDFYPIGTTSVPVAPAATLSLTKDTGNPSGASGLVIVGHSDLATIPQGSMAFAFARDTTNFRGIYGTAVVLSATLPAQGPYKAERDAHPTSVIEPAGGTPGDCVVTAGLTRVTMTRAADPAVVGRILLIFTNDASPDSDLDGNVIVAEGINYIDVHPTRPFSKGGNYQYLVVKRWWDFTTPDETVNSYYNWFDLNNIQNELYDAQWLTAAVSLLEGTFYATAYSRNAFGVGTRLTSAQKSLAFLWGVGQIVPGALPQNFQIVAGTIANNSPTAGKVAWSGVIVSYKGIYYDVTDDNTANKWIFWKLSSPTVFQSSASPPSLGNDEFYVGINSSGTFVTQHRPGQTIYAERIVAANLSAISADLGTVTAGSITSVTIAGGTITGTVFKTPAASGNRIEIGSSGLAKLEAITSGGTAVLTITAADIGNVLATIGNVNIGGALVANSIQTTSLSVTGTTISLGIKVILHEQEAGWTGPSGTATKGGFTTYTAPDITDPPTEAEVQAIADGLEDASRSLKAVIDALLYHGLIGT